MPYTVTLHYDGKVPLTVDYGNNPGRSIDAAMLDEFGGGTLELSIAYSDGQWICNSQPTFEPSAHTNWNLDGSEVLFFQQDIGPTTFSGPNKCPHGRGGLSLFGAAGEADC